LSLLFVRRHEGQRGGLPRVALVVGTVLGLLLTASAATAATWRYYTFKRLLNAAHRVDIPELRGTRPVLSPVAFLVLGSDGRDSSGYAQDPTQQVEGERADVIMVLLVNPTGGKATVLSIPRDTYVDVPGHGADKVNAGLDLGGASLQVRLVEQLSGIGIDHYVKVNFQSFVRIVDEFGGVDLCLPFDARDTYVGLFRQAGCSHYSGLEALGYVRSRHTEFLRNGVWAEDPEGDIGRIQRQQHFLEELLKKALGSSDVGKLPQYAADVGSVLTFDSGFGPDNIQQLLQGFSRPTRDAINFATLPGNTSTLDGISYVFPCEPDADKLLRRLGGAGVPLSSKPLGDNECFVGLDIPSAGAPSPSPSPSPSVEGSPSPDVSTDQG
jgi:LCP family protein required for cell wall assembly